MGQQNGKIIGHSLLNGKKERNSRKKFAKSSIARRGLPSELLNELFASLPLGNAFDFLAKMPNGLLARNLQKMINGIKMAMNANKLNADDCGPRLKILEGLVAKQSGPDESNSVRAVLPIPPFNLCTNNKPAISFYFEMQILSKPLWYGIIYIGFCDKKFPFQSELGMKNTKSIGIWHKSVLLVDGSIIKLGKVDDVYDDSFVKGDFVGLGIIHRPNSKIECFATCNGKMLGKTVLSPKFANLKIFPAVNLYKTGDSIRVNFDKEKWRFKEFECALELKSGKGSKSKK